jgi:hypothetical protein
MDELREFKIYWQIERSYSIDSPSLDGSLWFPVYTISTNVTRDEVIDYVTKVRLPNCRYRIRKIK